MAKKMTPIEALMASLAGMDMGKGAKAGAVGSSADTIVAQLNKALKELATMGPSTSPLRNKLRTMATKISAAAASGGEQVPGMVAEAQSLLGQVGEKMGLRKYESGQLSAMQSVASEGRRAESQAEASKAAARQEATKQRFDRYGQKLASEEAATKTMMSERAAAKEASAAKMAADSEKIKGLKDTYKKTVATEAKAAQLEKGLLGGVRGKLFRGLEPMIGGKWGGAAAKLLPELAVFALISQMTGMFEQNQQADEGLASMRSQSLSTDDYLEDLRNQRALSVQSSGAASGNQQAMQAMLQQMTPPGEVMFGAMPQQPQSQGASLQDILGQLAL